MDPLHAIGFYVSSGISLAGALGVALLPRRGQRGAALGVVGLGLAGVFWLPFARGAPPPAPPSSPPAPPVVWGPPGCVVPGGAPAGPPPPRARRARRAPAP